MGVWRVRVGFEVTLTLRSLQFSHPLLDLVWALRLRSGSCSSEGIEFGSGCYMLWEMKCGEDELRRLRSVETLKELAPNVRRLGKAKDPSFVVAIYQASNTRQACAWMLAS